MVDFTLTAPTAIVLEGGFLKFQIRINNPNYNLFPGGYKIQYRTALTGSSWATPGPNEDYYAVGLTSFIFKSNTDQVIDVYVLTNSDYKYTESSEYVELDLFDYAGAYMTNKVGTIVNVAPDLKVKDISPVSYAINKGDTFNYSYTIQNNGNTSAGISTSYIYVDENKLATGLLGSDGFDLFSIINSGSVVTNTKNFSTVGLAAGQHTLRVTADSIGIVGESSESNNSGSIAFTITQPDIKINGFVLANKLPLRAGKSTTASFSLANVGDGPAGNSIAQLYLSNDSSITTADRPLGTSLSVGALAAGASSGNFSMSITIPGTVTAGSYWIGVLADRDNNITYEANEDNNTAAQSIVIKAARPVLTGASVLNTAVTHLTALTGEVWGNANCTGFVYTVSYETSNLYGFFDPDGVQTQLVGPYGSDGGGFLINHVPPASDERNFLVPPVGSPATDKDDGWHLVGNTFGNTTTTINPDDPRTAPQPGDLFRGTIVGKSGLLPHSGVISAFDPIRNSIWMISNGTSGNAGAKIVYTEYRLGSPDQSNGIVGKFAIYRLDGAPTGDRINGAAKTRPDGTRTLVSDYLGGGLGNDTIKGGSSNDKLWGGQGSDVFIYDVVLDSSGAKYDTLADFDATVDKLDLWFPVSGIAPSVVGGSLSSESFVVDLKSAIGVSELAASHAVIFKPTAGNLSSTTFLVIDANKVRGYQAGGDLVVRLPDLFNVSDLSIKDFI